MRSASAARALGAASLLVLAFGCAKVAPKPATPGLRFPDFVYPAPPGGAAGEAAISVQRGWQLLQVGDVRSARKEFNAALKAKPTYFPADAALAYASLAERDYPGALAGFDRVLKQSARYVPALVGRGDALAGAGRFADAIKTFQAALDVDSHLANVRQRLDVLAFRVQQESLKAARQAADAGRYDQAAAEYGRAIASSPESAFLHRELAAVLVKQGKADPALAELRTAVKLDPAEAKSFALMGEILEGRGDLPGAIDAYSRAQAIEPSDDVAARLARARQGVDLARLPAEYRAIPKAVQITRGELAALVGVRLPALLSGAPGREGVVVTDARSHWATPWIMAAVRAGVMDPYPNHAFEPNGLVRRLDLAEVASRLLALVAERRPSQARRWQSARPRIADLPEGHLGYAAAAVAVGADVMPLGEAGTFRPADLVSGAEAVAVLGRIEGLAR